MNKTPIVIVVAVLVACIVFIVWPRGKATGDLDAFAQCLADKGAVMYGAEWCPHCQEEKRGFGASWRLIPYVECPADPAKCLAKGIEGYPTWLIGTSTRLVGTQGIEKLSQVTSCPIRLENQGR